MVIIYLLETNEFRTGIGAHWPFLSDPGRKIQKDLDIAEYTDPTHNPMIPHTIVLEPGLVVIRIYNATGISAARRSRSCGTICGACCRSAAPIGTSPNLTSKLPGSVPTRRDSIHTARVMLKYSPGRSDGASS
jgi:hypothetical protein